jgi:hypothetical protein
LLKVSLDDFKTSNNCIYVRYHKKSWIVF